MNNVLQFKLRPAQVDIDDLTADLFTALAGCRGIDTDALAAQFLEQHPQLKPHDLIAAAAFACRVLSVFERTLLYHQHRNAGDGGAA
jgi:hypothetical protein